MQNHKERRKNVIYLLVEGKISCVWKGEKQSVSFSNGQKIPDLNFSQGDIIRFKLEVKDVGGLNPLTQITAKRIEGILSFQVFPLGRQMRHNGLATFSLNANKEEQDYRLSRISVNEMYRGGVGSIDVELHIKRLIG